MNSLAFVLILLGLLTLSITMSRHARQLQRPPLSGTPHRTVQALAWGLLAVAMGVDIHAHGVGVGLTFWFVQATPAAALVVLLYTYRPAWLARFLRTSTRP